MKLLLIILIKKIKFEVEDYSKKQLIQIKQT